MKTKVLSLMSAMLLVLLYSCGGGGMSENKYLGELPAMANKYETEIDELKQKAKEATDMEDAFKYEKEYKLKKEEADQAIVGYVEGHEFTETIPFKELDGSRFTVESIAVTGASRERVNFEATIKVNEDYKNEYGGWEKYIFGYIKAVDAEGNTLGKATVLASPMGARKEYHAGDSEKLSGGIRPLSELGEFAAIQFISKEEYDQAK